MQVAIAKRSFQNDPHCGDQGGNWHSDERTVLCIVDGLGHGEDAEQAALMAMDYVAHHLSEPLSVMFAGCDQALRYSRGTVMGICVIDNDGATLTYAGVGNPRAMVVRAPLVESDVEPFAGLAEGAGGRTIHLLATNGIVGGGYRVLSPQRVQLCRGDLVIMVTDGIRERFDTIVGFGAATQHVDVGPLAQKILQDWNKASDDAAVLVFRNEG